MRTWLKANGGPLAIVVVGLGLLGVYWPIGATVSGIGALWFIGTLAPVTNRVPFEIRRKGAAPGGFVETDPLRVALIAVRSELGACGTRITEALSAKRWWMPDTDPLPAEQWKQQFSVLSNPALPKALHAQIELAYTRCDRLNHRIRRYLAEQKQGDPMLAAFAVGNYNFRVDDEKVLREALQTITDANGAISGCIDEDQE